jgi:hypothetical protein
MAKAEISDFVSTTGVGEREYQAHHDLDCRELTLKISKIILRRW